MTSLRTESNRPLRRSSAVDSASRGNVFNRFLGLFSEDIDENVVESHISKLRKRLRHRLGYDPIDSQRFLGYRLVYS